MTGLSAEAFGPFIRAARERSGLTQAEVADRAGVTAMTVSYIERRVCTPLLVFAVCLGWWGTAAIRLHGAIRRAERHQESKGEVQ